MPRAAQGDIPQFTGISSLYEPPLEPSVLIDTDAQSTAGSVALLTRFILDKCKEIPSR